MSFTPVRMKRLLTHDRFLHHTFEELKNKGVSDEDEALKMVFNSYVLNHPMKKNAYHYLT
ncbi:hypothetical protein [Desertibacillus haloalkaliphilus]|uniref:hypothetical protein n=1 Tax=Desertibacillus haloalkaliphilus TaxID=1328930 RepID=UPI001C269F45|nr:hypothetical protein [Desertibacillus haloalkaliphilus]